jgi:hypothetical protein
MEHQWSELPSLQLTKMTNTTVVLPFCFAFGTMTNFVSCMEVIYTVLYPVGGAATDGAASPIAANTRTRNDEVNMIPIVSEKS